MLRGKENERKSGTSFFDESGTPGSVTHGLLLSPGTRIVACGTILTVAPQKENIVEDTRITVTLFLNGRLTSHQSLCRVDVFSIEC